MKFLTPEDKRLDENKTYIYNHSSMTSWQSELACITRAKEPNKQHPYCTWSHSIYLFYCKYILKKEVLNILPNYFYIITSEEINASIKILDK